MKIQYSFLLVITVIFLLTPNIASAVNLPWSTTYNCADWTQSNGLYNVNCDGLSGNGNWTCNNGDGTIRKEQITAAANYPNGSGGKGQRHWLGDGVNNISGEMRIDWSPTPQNEIWIRWYMRYESGFRWKNLVDNKILTVNSGYINRTIFGFEWSDQIRIYSNGYNGLYYSAVGDGWRGIMGGDAGDGKWHLYEIHLKMDTNGNDGIAEAWVDGIKRVSYTNANFGGLQGAPGWSALQIASNSNSPSNGRCMAVDYDDLMISGIPASTAGNSSGSDESSDASISGGGCGFVNDGTGKSGSNAVHIFIFFLPLILIRLWKLLKIKEWNY